MILQAQWVAIFVAAIVAPLLVRPWVPVALWPWSLAIALAIVGAIVGEFVGADRGLKRLRAAFD